MSEEINAELLRRLAHYAYVYVPGPRWREKEAASRAKQAHLDGVMAGRMADLLEKYPGLLGSAEMREEAVDR